MKKADFRYFRGNVTFYNCTFESEETSSSSNNKLKNFIIIALALILLALVVSLLCPELLPDIIRFVISVATGN